jgi:hypothetical protein
VGLLWASLSLPLHAGFALPGSLTLAWDAVSDPGVAGYNIYYGTTSQVYPYVVHVGDTNVATIFGLVPGITYFIAMTTRLATGLESAYSDEIVFSLPSTVPVIRPSALPAGQVGLAVSAPAGHTYDVLATEDFALWLSIGTVTVDASGAFNFIDPDAAQYPSRFYQLHETTYTVPGSLPVFNRITASDAGLQVQITGQVGHTYEILTTQDMQVWGVVGFATVGIGGSGTATVPANPYFPISFYKLRETDYASAQTLAPFMFYSILPGFVQILYEVEPGLTYTFLKTGDFSSWTSITSLRFLDGGTAAFTDAFDPAGGPRTYRLSVSN